MTRALLLDVGNTRIKWGVWDSDRIRSTGSVTQEKIRERGLAALTTRLPSNVDTVLASNVAGASFATRLSGVLRLHCDAETHFAQSLKEMAGLKNSYRQPRRLGVDRWVAMVGAWCEYQAPMVVVDIGTAMTIDAIDADGQHLGGQIVPGIQLMAEVLADGTEGLPSVAKRKAKAVRGVEMFADNTSRAIEQGLLNAVVGAIERAAWAVNDASGEPLLVLTGGDASRILSSLDDPHVHRPHLVLEGLARILEEKA
ncbi:MAG: type III pantothenate kinase [Pseudomonadota bacterium]